MNIDPNLNRTACINAIVKNEKEKLFKASMEQFALPFIARIGKQYEATGGLSHERKVKIYNSLQEFFGPKLNVEITSLVYSVLLNSFASLTDEELRIKAMAIREKSCDKEPDWSKTSHFCKDATLAFKEFTAQSNLKIESSEIQQRIAPRMIEFLNNVTI